MTKILLIEDNEMNRDMLSRRLSMRGFDVVVAIDGTSGAAAATSEQPDLILMDVSLPDMDGFEVTRLLRSRPATASIPIIALTAHSMETDRLRAVEAGCQDYDTKPVDLTRLLAKINAALSPSPDLKGMSVIETFLVDMQHELRTPVNAILGYGQLLLEEHGDTLSVEARHDLERVIEAGHQLLRIVSEGLDVGQQSGDDVALCAVGMRHALRPAAHDRAGPGVSADRRASGHRHL